jgi:hypothetical protein
MSGRLIDPVEHVRRTMDEQLGVVPQRDLVVRGDRTLRYDAAPKRNQEIIVFETIEYVQYNMPASTDGAMFQMYAASSSTISLNNAPIDICQMCKVCAVRIHCPAPGVSAGTVRPFLQVTEGSYVTEYVFDECELSVTEPRRKGLVLPWEQSIQIAKDAEYLLALRTDAAFLPTTLEFKAQITFGYPSWIPS